MTAKMAISKVSNTHGMPTLTSIYDTLGPVVMTGFSPEDKKEMSS